MAPPILLTENGPPTIEPLADDVASDLLASRLVAVEPWGEGRYRLVPGARVGTVRLERAGSVVDVRVEPKVGIARLLFLLGYASDPGWRDEDLEVREDADLLPAIVDALARSAMRALAAGVLQGYRTVEESLPLVRGRLLADVQMGKRFGLLLPAEVRFDQYDADIAENQILLAACRLSLGVPRVREETRSRLLHAVARLDGVSNLRPGELRPAWRVTRLNERYMGALRLAELVLSHLSIERGDGDYCAAAFVVSMWKAYEDFVTVAFQEAMGDWPGVANPQFPVDLDVAGLVPMKPDIVYLERGNPCLVLDAKYKAEGKDGFPNADAYQLLAYCTALGLKRGHLVYAAGNEEPRVYDIQAAGVIVSAHALDLSGSPDQILAKIKDLADAIRHGQAA